MNGSAEKWDGIWATRKRKRTESAGFRRVTASLSVVTREFSGIGWVLDAGCGIGRFSKFFLDKGLKVICLDHSERALEMAKEFTGGRAAGYVKADLLSSSLTGVLSGRKFDLVFTDGLLEHFVKEDRLRILSNLKSVLNDKGLMYDVVPNRFSPWQLIRPFFYPGIYEKPLMLKELVALHEEAGLKVISSGGYNVLPFAFSPESIGKYVGMLLYVAAKAKDGI